MTNSVKNLANYVKSEIGSYCHRIEIAGSIRRQDPNPRDIDIICVEEEFPESRRKIKAFISWRSDKILAMGDNLFRFIIDGVQVDLYFTTKLQWGAMLIHATGPAGSNIGLRCKAKRLGFKLNQYGLWSRYTDNLVASRTEAEIYRALGHPMKPPELRGR